MEAKKHALVCSGGGAFGAYEVGVLKGLAEGAPAIGYRSVRPEILTGTSVGAYNASFLASRWTVDWPRAVAELERVWLDVISDQSDGHGNGVFRYRFDPFKLFDPLRIVREPWEVLASLIDDSVALGVGTLQRIFWWVTEVDEPVLDRLAGLFDLSAFISTGPMRELILETIDFDRLRRTHHDLTIAATNWSTGTVVLAGPEQMTEAYGVEMIRASASIPGIFPSQPIADDLYVDGGVLMNTPMGPAIHAGADVLHVIDLFPEMRSIPLRTISSTIGAMNRAQTSSWNFILESQSRHCASINRMLQAFAMVRERIRTSTLNETHRENLLEFLAEVADYSRRRMGRTTEYRLLEIHFYHPQEPLHEGPLGMLLFNREDVESFMARGREDAVGHDCARSHCVLPGMPPSAEAVRLIEDIR